MHGLRFLALTFLFFLALGTVLGKFELTQENFERLVFEVQRLSDLTEKQNGVIQELTMKHEQQAILNRDLNTRMSQHEAVINELQRKLAQKNECENSPTSTEPVHNATALRDGTSTKRQAIRRQTIDPVAFFAVMTQASEDNIGLHQNIIFEDVVTNIGNAFNSHHGLFIVPVSGIYLITTSCLSRQDQEYWAEVVVNNVPIARLNGHGMANRHATGTQTVIIFLNKGDDVAVQNYLHVDSFWGDKYSSFGGVLLQEYEPAQPAVVG